MLASQRDLIGRSLAGLGQGARVLRNVLGPSAPPAQTMFASTPFAPYTSRDCPRYPGLPGPRCGAPVRSAGPSLPMGSSLPNGPSPSSGPSLPKVGR